MEQPDYGLVTFENVFALQRAPMIRLAYVLLNDNGDAEEVVQDAFTQLLRRWEQVNDPVPYLRSSVINGCRKKQRWRAVRQRISPPAPSPSPEYEYVADLIQRLSPRRRTIIVLRYYAGLSESEIAESLGISPGTVKSNLNRAMETLRKEVRPDGR